MAGGYDSKNENENRSFVRVLLRYIHLDPQLLALLFALIALGVLVLYSASDQSMARIIKQGVRLGMGLGVMLFIAQIPPRNLRAWTPYLYGIGVLMLIAVWVFGEMGKGAQRWLDLGFMRFQPSELMKLTVPMMVAWYFSDKPLPVNWKQLAIAGAIIFLPMGLIAKQPDLGTALLVGSAGFFVIFLGGLSWRFMFGLGAVISAIAPVFWHFGMRDYQRQRVLTFLNPESDPLGSGYHIIQSKVAIGSGGVYGKGWLNGTQSHLDFLPERHTDFIFSVFGEEFGLLGNILLMGLYILIIGRSLYIATQAVDTYGRLIAGSVALTFFVYLFVNTGMVTGLLPVVGVPLPLVSYGGTSVVTLMAGFGIIMSIHTHRRFLSVR